MARIKHTKNELKAQREALARYERFLPMLQLKKQQLQAEVQAVTARIAENTAREAERHAAFGRYSALFADPVDVEALLEAPVVRISEGNIAGVSIPILDGIDAKRIDYDLMETPPWVDDAVDMLDQIVRLRVERRVLEEQRAQIADELRTTSQRVNLFEKVKIPECRESIRVVRIFLGDEQTAGVARSKIAKRRLQPEVSPAHDAEGAPVR